MYNSARAPSRVPIAATALITPLDPTTYLKWIVQVISARMRGVAGMQYKY